MEKIDLIVSILKNRGRGDLSELLEGSDYDFYQSGDYGSRWFSQLTSVNIYSNVEKIDELRALPEKDKDEIIKAFLTIYPVRERDIEINDIEFLVSKSRQINEKELENKDMNKIELDFWKEDYFRLFISHSSKMKDFAHALKGKFEDYAISSFVAHDDIEPSEEWQNVILNALTSCDGLIALINDDFHNSKWTDQEVGVCIGLEKIVIPITFGIDPYGFIGKYQGLKVNKMSINQIVHKTYNILKKNDKSKKKIANAITKMFINSESFAEAKRNIGILEEIKYLDENLIKELEKALTTKRQVYDSWGVPDRVKILIERFFKNN